MIQQAWTVTSRSNAIEVYRDGRIILAGLSNALIDAGVDEIAVTKSWVLANSGGGGVTDHGALSGLSDDDHSQYHNDARGDIRYGQLAVDNVWQGAQTFEGRINTVASDASGNGVIYRGSQRFFHTSGGQQEYVFDTGFPNTFLGKEAGNLTTTSTSNTGIGNYVLSQITTGVRNTGIGSSALQNLQTGVDNMAMGSNALAFLVSGGSNVGVGKNPLQNITTGVGNIGIGRNAGFWFGNVGGSQLTNAEQSIYIGHQAIPLADASTNEIVIGAEAIGGGDNTSTFGHTNITDCYIRGLVHNNKSIAEIDAASNDVLVTKEWVQANGGGGGGGTWVVLQEHYQIKQIYKQL